MRKLNGLIAALALVSASAHAVDLDDVRSLRKGHIAGVDYTLGTKSLRLKGAYQGLEAAAKLGYDGESEITVRQAIRDGRLTLELRNTESERAVYFRLERRF